MLDDPSPGEVDSGADLPSQLLRHVMFAILVSPKPDKHYKPYEPKARSKT